MSTLASVQYHHSNKVILHHVWTLVYCAGSAIPKRVQDNLLATQLSDTVV